MAAVVVVTILITIVGSLALWTLPPLGFLAVLAFGHPVGTLAFYLVSALLAAAIVHRIRKPRVAT